MPHPASPRLSPCSTRGPALQPLSVLAAQGWMRGGAAKPRAAPRSALHRPSTRVLATGLQAAALPASGRCLQQGEGEDPAPAVLQQELCWLLAVALLSPSRALPTGCFQSHPGASRGA